MGEQLTTRQTTQAIKDALRLRYTDERSQYALMWEVANTTGHGKMRYLDAVAMGLWPSHGLYLEGIEIKATRSDWRRELKSPAKQSEGLFMAMDFWWIAAAKGVVKPEELPRTWGLLELQPATANRPAHLKVIVQAPKLSPEPLTRSQLAPLLRRAPADPTDQRIAEAYERGKADGAALAARLAPSELELTRRELEWAKRDVGKLETKLREAEQAIGIVGPEPFGQSTVKAILALQNMLSDDWRLRNLIEALDKASVASKGLRKLLQEIPSKA